MKIDLSPVTRIEGHARLLVEIDGERLVTCRFGVIEAPRFFEGLLRGRHYSDVAPIIARICGVCSHSHTLVSLAASEAAFDITVSEQTDLLRRLLLHGEIMQSHILQLYFMALPDYLDVSGIAALAKSRRDVVARALRLKKLGNDLCLTVGGRAVHPVTPCVGGFAALPAPAALQELRRHLVDALPDLEESVELFATLPLPDFQRASECLSLDDAHGYPLFGAAIVSNDGAHQPLADYGELIREYLPAETTAKHARAGRESYMVGPLARVTNNGDQLSPMARQVAAALGLWTSLGNPYRNLHARLVEVVHGVESAIQLIDRLLLAGLAPEPPLPVTPHAGSGCAAVEAPRGLLLHSYRYDERGCIENAECIIPTAQNLANIEADLRALIPPLLPLPTADLQRRIESLVRSYDPCISCATHLLYLDTK
jgi:coenzyme F420-reducing hydrogenase alpha subunit